jgi:hypothetical protein
VRVDLGALERAQVGTVVALQRARDPRVRRRQRPPRDRRRMRRQHERDLHPAGDAVQVGRRGALQNLQEDLLEGSALALRRVLALVVAAAADAVVLLGNVGERQKVRERPRHRHRHLDRQVAHRLLEQRHPVLAPLPRLLGDAADALDRLEEGIPFARPDRVAQHAAEHRHVFAEPLMRIGHGSRCWACRNAPTAGKNAGSFSLA